MNLTREEDRRMPVLFLALLLVCMGTAYAAEKRANLIGFVEIPGVFGEVDPRGPPGQSTPEAPANILLREDPSADAPNVGRITGQESVVSHEFGYEEYAAGVYGRSGDWVLLALKEGGDEAFGWIAPDHRGTYHALEDQGLSYLTEHWDGQLHERPSGMAIPVLERDIPVHQAPIDVVEVRGSGPNAWLSVKLLRQSRCFVREPEVIAEGWIKLHDQDGNPTAWFRPRGC